MDRKNQAKLERMQQLEWKAQRLQREEEANVRREQEAHNAKMAMLAAKVAELEDYSTSLENNEEEEEEEDDDMYDDDDAADEGALSHGDEEEQHSDDDDDEMAFRRPHPPPARQKPTAVQSARQQGYRCAHHTCR